ncbi:MAG: hypothetical protein MUF72_06935 [Elainella sp. Prado103]|jgi:hypothetical protein|nr:hypothetical protein [Elainella sp. Prado103]
MGEMQSQSQPWYAFDRSVLKRSAQPLANAVKPDILTQISAELSTLTGRVLIKPPIKLPIKPPIRLPIKLPTATQKRLQRWSHRLVRHRNWLLSGVGVLLLWVWLWQWLLAITIGLTVTVAVYLAQQGQLRLPGRRSWQKLWKPTNRSLTLSCLAGGLALAYTYLATAVWLESEQHWLVSTILLQGLGMLAIGSWLLWRCQSAAQEAGSSKAVGEAGRSWLLALSDADPLQRLIAVRQLTRQALSVQTASMTAAELSDCFRLMLDRETESVVCNALIESLQMLGSTRQITATQLSGAEFSQPLARSMQQDETLIHADQG